MKPQMNTDEQGLSNRTKLDHQRLPVGFIGIQLRF